jgi:hypothetical protein
MLFPESGLGTPDPIRRFSEPGVSVRFKHPDGRADPAKQGSELAALAETPLASRFCSWEGLSGRCYVFSVYTAAECPAFFNAVLLAAVRHPDGRRQAVSVFDTGQFPEPILLGAKRALGPYGAALEFHLHLLAATPAERADIRADLAARWA